MPQLLQKSKMPQVLTLKLIFFREKLSVKFFSRKVFWSNFFREKSFGQIFISEKSFGRFFFVESLHRLKKPETPRPFSFRTFKKVNLTYRGLN